MHTPTWPFLVLFLPGILLLKFFSVSNLLICGGGSHCTQPNPWKFWKCKHTLVIRILPSKLFFLVLTHGMI